MKLSGIFKNDTFILKKVPRGSEKSTAGKNCNNQICRGLSTMNCFMFVFDTNTFSKTRGTFLSMKVWFLKIPLYFMFGAHL